MKNTILKTIGGTAAALAIVMLAVLALVQVRAQDNSNEQKSSEQMKEDASEQIGNERDLEGAWNFQVTLRNCQTGAALRPPFPAMNTFMRGGTMQEFGIGSGLLRSPGHGIWTYNSGSYTNTLQFFRFNADGTYAGTQKVRREIELSRFGNPLFGSNLTATSTVEIFNPNGVLIATGCATETATRLQ